MTKDNRQEYPCMGDLNSLLLINDKSPLQSGDFYASLLIFSVNTL